MIYSAHLQITDNSLVSSIYDTSLTLLWILLSMWFGPSETLRCVCESPGCLFKMPILLLEVWGGAWDPAFLMCSHVRPELLVKGSCFEQQGSKDHRSSTFLIGGEFLSGLGVGSTVGKTSC